MGDDRTHFESYREQTRVKHAILAKYLPAFFNILKTGNRDLLYVDAFAGRGSYLDSDGTAQPGSPLLTLQLLSQSSDFAVSVTTVFIEKDPVLAESLKHTVAAFYAQNAHIRKPIVKAGEFKNQVNAMLDWLDSSGRALAPSFLFVDPCGVSGTDFSTVRRFLANRSSEAFIFFNVNGIRRILGLQDASRGTLPELLGGEANAEALIQRVGAAATPFDREEAIVQFYSDLLVNETGARYVTPFRVEREDQRTSSHYLIHATSHPKGFRIMKDVMWSEGRRSGTTGGLAFEQASYDGQTVSLFDVPMRTIQEEIRRELRARSPRRAAHFYETLVEQPKNLLSTKAYRAALLDMEARGELVVLAKDGRAPAGPRRKGTLAKDYFLQLKSW